MVSFKLGKTDIEQVCCLGLRLEERFCTRAAILKFNLCLQLIVMLLTRAWFLFKWHFTHLAARLLAYISWSLSILQRSGLLGLKYSEEIDFIQGKNAMQEGNF